MARKVGKAPSATEAVLEVLSARGIEASVDVSLVDGKRRLSVAVAWEVEI